MRSERVDSGGEQRPAGRTAIAIGACSGAVAVVTVMPWFYPLGRLLDPTIGGDTRIALSAEVALGLFAGVVLSPLGAAAGALLGWHLRARRLGIRMALTSIAGAVAVAVALFALLNGGLVDERGTSDSLRYVVVLGALAGFVGLAVHEACRRLVAADRIRLLPSNS